MKQIAYIGIRLRIVMSAILAMTIHFQLPAHQYSFTHYDISTGLSQNTVHEILQDRQGFMWFATKDGLNRFDGVNFRRIEIAGEEGSVSFISTIFEDSRGKIWIASHKGPCIYDPETEIMRWFDTPDSEGVRLSNLVNNFEESPDGRIFISSENDGVFEYNPATGRLRRLLKNSQEGVLSVTQLCFTAGGRLYVGTFGNGLYFTDDDFKSLHPVASKGGKPYFENAVVNSLKYHNGRLYVATDNMGLHSIDEKGVASPVFVRDENGEIPIMRALNFNRDSQVFIGTESGLYIYDLANKKLDTHLRHDYFDRYSLSDDAIYCVVSDREGGIWIGSYFGGVDYQGVRNPEFIKYFKTDREGSLKSERIRELCRDAGGRIYIGSEDGGLACFDPLTEKFKAIPGINERNIHGLCIDGNDLWVGTFSEGIIIVDLNTNRQRRIRAGQKEQLQNDYVFSVCRTQDGDIFAGTFNGLTRYDRNRDVFVEIEALHGNFIYDIIEDSHGNLWVATYSNGLFVKKADESEWRQYLEDSSDPRSLPSNKIYSVQEDERHNIWILTQNGACIYRENNTFDRSYMGVDKIQGVVYRIEEDGQGRYWLTSNHGIYCIDPHKEAMWNFTTHEGLPTNQFNYNSSLKTPDGKIYFGSINGLICFEPLKFVPERIKEVKPVITEFYVHSELIKPGMKGYNLPKSISLSDKIELEPWQNSISFSFATFSYSTSAGQQIKYRLKGYDDNWRYTELGEMPVSYINLPPGHYSLEAALCSSEDDFTGPQYNLAVVIDVPLYARWWAILGYVALGVLILGILYFYYRRYTRVSNQRYIENFKHEKERELFDSQIKFFTNVAHEIRTPLTLIKAPLDSAIHNDAIKAHPDVRESLDVINRNVERLLYLADQLLDFRKIESKSYNFLPKECNITQLLEETVKHFIPTIDKMGINLTINQWKHDITGCVDTDALSKIFSNLLSNAVKYGKTYIRITSEEEGSDFVLKIANDGNIIPVENREKIFGLFTRLEDQVPGTGLGLAYARSLASMHGGKLTIDDTEEENLFVLRIPLNCEKNETSDKGIPVTDLDIIGQESEVNFHALIVEDNPELRLFLQKKLIEGGYKVYTAANGADALTIVNEQYIDIVITDIMMPEIDGYELLSRLKEDERYSHIPVILLSAKTRMEDKLSGLGLGADLFIEKPFSTEYLLMSMQSLLRNRDRIRMRLESVPLEKIPEKELSKADEEFLKKMIKVIHDNFSNPDFSVEDIIEKLGLSSSAFYRKVKTLLNLNPNEYIKLQRLKQAASLFKEGKTSISEVCYLVGFSSPGYFTKCFQKQYGISPKEYIAKIKSTSSDKT